MPIYEYKCVACNLKFEVKRGFNEGMGADCPQCQCQAQRVFSPVPIVFKGPGFYVTDNAHDGRGGYNGKGDGDKPAEKVSESESAKTSEKTPASEPAKTKADEVKV